MIKLFRKIRKSLLAENRFKKYLIYAVGEIVLVVIGILIAIQINNANQKRLNLEALQGYLNSIAQNIDSDLKKAERITQHRLDLLPKILMIRSRMDPAYYQLRSEVYGDSLNLEYRYSVANLDYMSSTIMEAWKKTYLTPNCSGFESLTNSGFLSQLQGTDLEKLLFDYYNLLEELTTLENNYNSSLQSSFDDFVSANLSGTNAFFNPGSRDWNTDLGRELPAMIDEVVEHPTVTPIFFFPYELILKYENLIITGQSLHELIITGKKDFTEKIRLNLEPVFDEYSEVPYPKVVRDGYATMGYSSAVASSNNSYGVNRQYMGSHTTIQFESLAWGVTYWYIGDGVVDPDRTKDFSSFDTLHLKLRGVNGGEKIAVSLKDISNPIDGSESKVPITLTTEWQDYKIPLPSFEPIRLEEVFMVTSISAENQACAIEIESIEFY